MLWVYGASPILIIMNLFGKNIMDQPPGDNLYLLQACVTFTFSHV